MPEKKNNFIKMVSSGGGEKNKTMGAIANAVYQVDGRRST
jgi:hypothetical protein